MEKERNKEKRERVGYVLTHRFINKFGPKYESIITFFVEEFLSTKDEVNSGELEILEKEIRNAIKAKNDEMTSKLAKSVRVSSAPTTVQEVNSASASPTTLTRPPSGKEWQVIQVLQALQEEEEETAKRAKAAQDKLAFRAALEKQMKVPKSGMARGEDDEVKYVSHVQHDLVAFAEENRRKKEAHKRKYDEELRIRRAQIDDQNRRLAEDREAQRRAEERNAALLQETIEKEARTLAEAKAREHERQLRIARENRENKAFREEEKRREAEEDQRLMREYAAKLDREAAEREQAFTKRVKEMEVYASKFENDGAGKALREDKQRFEQMLLVEQQRKEAADKEKERRKEEEKERKVREALVDNRRILAKKAAAVVEDKEADAHLKQRFQADMEEYNRQCEEKKRKQREAQDRYRSALDVQAEAVRRSDSRMIGITPAEKQINLPTLRALEEDPVLMSKVMHRLRISKSRGAMK